MGRDEKTLRAVEKSCENLKELRWFEESNGAEPGVSVNSV